MHILTRQEKVRNLLLEAKTLITEDASAPKNFAELNSLALQEELSEEINQLTEFLDNPETFSAEFKKRFQSRIQDNNHTTLSLQAAPQSICNTLYWNIAQCIFNPKTLGEMLEIILPAGCHRLTIAEKIPHEFKQASAKQKLQAIEFELKPVSLSSLKNAPDSTLLQHFVFTEKMLFDIRDIASYDFQLHFQLYEKLNTTDPTLAKALYQHNRQLKELSADIELIAKKGQTPREAFNRLIHELELGGTKITNKDFATQEAAAAYLRCEDYLASLPQELRHNVLSLKDTEKLTVKKVFQDLQQGHCVETAAAELRAILRKYNNNPVLDCLPTLSEEDRKKIVQRYNTRLRANNFNTEGKTETITVPANFAKKFLSRIEIKNGADYLNFILDFPLEYYSVILESAKITSLPQLPNELAKIIFNNWISTEQLTAFNHAIMNNIQKYGGIKEVLAFASKSNNMELIKKLITTYPEVIQKKDSTGKTLLHQRANNLGFLLNVLQSLPEEQRFNALKEQDSLGLSVLHFVPLKINWIKELMELLPQKDRVAALKLKDNKNCALMHRFSKTYLTYHDFYVQDLLKLVPKNERFNLLLEKNHEGKTILDFFHILGSLKNILPLLMPKDRFRIALRAICNSNCKESPWPLLDKKLREQINNQHGTISELLNVLPKEERLHVLKEKDASGKSILDEVVELFIRSPFENFNILKTILVLLPQNERLHILKIKDNSGEETLIDIMAWYPTIIENILPALSAKDCLKAVTMENNRGLTVLYSFLADTPVLNKILNSLAQEDRLTAIAQNSCTENIMHKAFENPHILRTILQSLPQKDRFKAIKLKNSSGHYILHSANKSAECMYIICLSLAEKENTTTTHEALWSLEKNYSLSQNKELSIKTLRQKIISNFQAVSMAEKLFLIAQDIDFEEERAQKHNEFSKSIRVLKTKADDLASRGYEKASEQLTELHRQLENNAACFFADEPAMDGIQFKKQSFEAINKVRPELEHHRGFKKILSNIGLAIIGLGIGYAVAGLIHKQRTGNFLFFNKTDSENKLDEVSSVINTLTGS